MVEGSAFSINTLSLFWTSPSDQERTRPSDPLGLDSIREELADKLVPLLTGRTRRVEDFLWTLAILKWSGADAPDVEKLSNALQWERRLKLWWCHIGMEQFTGIRRARVQCAENGAPRYSGRALLRDQRSQGLIGAHLRPLRNLGFVQNDSLALTTEGEKFVEGVGEAPKLKDGDWKSWNAAFSRADQGIGRAPTRQLRKRICVAMPMLETALRAVRWRKDPAWNVIAKYLGKDAPYAEFASQFLPWSAEVKRTFDRFLKGKTAWCPSYALRPPNGLQSWKGLAAPFVERLSRHEQQERVLAEWHKYVYKLRGYGDGDLLAVWEDGKFMPGPQSASYISDAETYERDCRWSNAISVMRPRN